MSKIVDKISKESITHGSLPFWSWNDKLEENELREQVRRMHELGMNGFFMHARSGLETEYMSDDWFNCINACVDEAKKLGMEAWSYDENGWPSGFAGGELLKDKANCAVGLDYKVVDAYPTEDNVLVVYVCNDGKYTVATKDENGPYHVLYTMIDVSYVDTLDPNIVDKFIASTHEKYKEKVGFGKFMPGFFTDEPQYNRWSTPYSLTLPTEFKKAYGYELLPCLIKLFVDCDGCEEFRYDYHLLLHNLFIENFAKRIYDWCEENGCKLTGHAIEETCLSGQMLCCGGVMPFYEYEHIPGIDYLTRNINTDLSPKQLGSVCAQTGKKKAISEMFACCGWDVTPTELKRIAELQYVGGVNMMCQHLYPYSERGQRKRDYPNHYSYHLSWQDKMAEFNAYFNNLGYTLSLGEEFVNTLVIHPMHSAYLKYKRSANYDTLWDLDENLRQLSALLGSNQVPYHYGDENMMKRLAKVENDKFIVGKCSYKYVVIPKCYTLDSTTVELLKKFIANGGKVWLYSDAPYRIDGKLADCSWLKSNCEFKEISESSPLQISVNGSCASTIRAQIRDTEFGKVFYITNLGFEKLVDVEVKIANSDILSSVNMQDLSVESVREEKEGNGVKILLDFNPAQSYVLASVDAKDTLSYENSIEKEYLPMPKNWEFASEPINCMNLDKAEMSFDGKSFTDMKSIEEIRDTLLRKKHNGLVWLKHKFTVDGFNGNLNLCAEPLKYKSIEINGQSCTFSDNWWFDKSFKTIDISSLIKNGENEIVYSFEYYQRDYVYYVLYAGVNESLRNSLAFDTEVEDIYLFGNFALKTDKEKFIYGDRNSVSYDGQYVIVNQNKTINPYDIVTEGYPFLCGKVELVSSFNYSKGMPTYIRLGGRYSVADVSVNDGEYNTLLFDNVVDLSKYLVEGENKIKIVLYNSPRNLMGPHHRPDPEPYCVCPNTFSYENEWHDGQCNGEYLDRYAFVRFGLNVDKQDDTKVEFTQGHLKL